MIKKVDEKVFKQIKLMVAGGGKRTDVAEILGLSRATIDRVMNVENFNEYKTTTKERFAEQAENCVQPGNKQTIEINLDKINETLNSIQQTILLLVDAWKGAN